ncbi:sensor histidine kinase [Mucilaginibacter psychrotolerans]|uniref:Histidine kinase n=1 Tax=Mucilaginibacter psychrotolerans TaxID=1524096 RepID=A0A4Y8SE24_9SPHI|nr:histidine kinase [Mucilaginibacter psychrotolerans]TFF36860.1 histidine kinase [Mucilaginibacter psychrotolerans]
MNAFAGINSIKIPRVWQHILFWITASAFITSIYAVQTDYVLSFRNNLFYMPVQIAYYYALAYWLLPRYLFVGKYLLFFLMTVPLVLLSTLVSRGIGLTFVIPYMIKQHYATDPDYIRENSRPFFTMLFDFPLYINAFKGTNLIIGFVLAIKFFKMWYERKQSALVAELSALKAQVHPHFLFNTLNNLYALSLSQSPKSPQVILGLSDLLRYMLYECNTGEVPLEKEVFMMQQYVKLEKLRYEDRIDLSFNITGNLRNKMIAPLLMLPFIENAFKHGASETMGQVWITIDIAVKGESLKLKVANNNPEKQQATPGEAHGLGLKNVAKRLALLYPGTSNLKIIDEDDTFLIVLDLDLKVVPQPAAEPQPLNELATA